MVTKDVLFFDIFGPKKKVFYDYKIIVYVTNLDKNFAKNSGLELIYKYSILKINVRFKDQLLDNYGNRL